MKKQTLWLYRDWKQGAFCLSDRHPEWQEAHEPRRDGYWRDLDELIVERTYAPILSAAVGAKNMPTKMTDLYEISPRTGKVIEKWEWRP